MDYVYPLPAEMAFDTKGLFGYSFGPMQQKQLEIYYIVVENGHDTFMISKKITRIYYVLAGSGSFTIAGKDYDVETGMLIEVPPKVEFSYSGKMTLLGISNPRWFAGNDTVTRWNPAVVRGDSPRIGHEPSRLKRWVGLRLFGKSPVSAFLRLHQPLWKMLPERLIALRPFRSYGDLLHALARVQGVRAQAFSTFFLRNRPQLELIRRLIGCRAHGSTLNVAVLGCSMGAEAYSVAWTIRTARPDLRLVLHAVDISRQAIQIAKRGCYPVVTPALTPSELFDRMSDREITEMFDIENDVATVKAWLREGIEWIVGDVGDLKVSQAHGCGYDIVTANNFLCHMDVPMAERALRNISGLVSSDGYLFVSGVDLEVRTAISTELGWEPVEELLEEIHDGDPCMKSIWPCHYGGLEPLSKRRPDWRRRYAAAFRMTPAGAVSQSVAQPRLGNDKGRASSPGRAVSAAAFAADDADRVSAAR